MFFTMTKRILALLLCAATLLSMIAVFTGCSGAGNNEKGQSITMYLTDNVYDLDPAKAYNNEALTKVVSLMFDTLFTLDSNGKLQKSLVKSYEFKEDKTTGEQKLEIRIKDDACWSDGTPVTSSDVVYAWKRIIETDASYEAAALLYDIKNARLIREGELTEDDLGVSDPNSKLLEIRFEEPAEGETIDYEQFLVNLTSVALAPLRDTAVSKGECDAGNDWAKRPGTIVCSGPFKLSRVNWQREDGKKETQTISSFILERNNYYYRNPQKDSVTKTVTPYRICVDCSLTSEQLLEAYRAGVITFIGDIPLDLRQSGELDDVVDVADKSMSTNSIYLNQNALIKDGSEEGTKLFANENVRRALSMAIDREKLVETVKYAEVATGLLPTGMFEAGSVKSLFRDKCAEQYEALTKDMDEAKKLIADIDPSDYSFELTVAAYDDVHCAIAELVAAAWGEEGLGFKVKIRQLGTIANDDYYAPTNSTPEDLCDDLFSEALAAGDFEAIIFDYCAYTPDPYSMLAPFARAFSGRGMSMEGIYIENEVYELTPHVTGYDSEAYNELMETIYAEKNYADRAKLYRDAEAQLMADMPIIPLVFNLDATVTGSNIKKVSSSYYSSAVLTKLVIKDEDAYLAAGQAFVTDNFDDLKFYKTSNNPITLKEDYAEGSQEYKDAMLAAIAASSTVYSHFIPQAVEEETTETEAAE